MGLLKELQKLARQAVGAAEAGASIGTGALSSAVGMPYGIYKNLTSDKFGTQEGISLAEKEAADFIARNTYSPRTEEGQSLINALGRAVEDSKMAPIGDLSMMSGILSGVGKTPAKATAKDFQEYNRQLAVPGASYAYLPNTPSKPNPLVGTRYKVDQVPGTQAARREGNLDDLLGASLITYPTDMLSRNMRVSEVSGIPLDNPFITPGGLEYASDLKNIEKKIGYASGKGASTAQNNRAINAARENLARGGTGRVYMAPHTMPFGGENFSTGPTDGLLSIIDTVGMSPELAGLLSDRVRDATVKGVKGKYKDFVGIGDSGLREQLMTGAGLSSGSAGDLRKVFVDKLSSAAAEKGLGFNYKDLQNAIMNQYVMDKPAFWMGDTIYEALPHLGTSKGSHPAYAYDMPGQFWANTKGAPISEVMGDVYRKAVLENTGKPGSRPGTFADADQLARGSLSTAGENVSLFIDEKELKRLKKLLGNR